MMLNNEEWKDIEGYEGIYQISNYGKVKNVKTNKILAFEENFKGYLRVSLCKNGNHKHHRVHRLVGKAFISNPYELPQINHIDENKKNNYYKNLEWCDNWYNNHYGSKSKKVNL